MKKKLLIFMSILTLWLIALVIGLSGDETIDPAVEKALAYRPPQEAPENNAFIGICGLGFVHDGNIVEAGLKYLENNGQGLKDPQPGEDFDFSYKNPCLEDPGKNCLEQIAAEAQAVQANLDKNRVLLDRYRTVQKMPLFVNTSSNIFDRGPRYQFVINSSKLIGAQTLLELKQGDLESGLDALERELAFYQKMTGSEHISLVDLMISVAGLHYSLTVISKTIEDELIDLKGSEGRIWKMLDLNLDTGLMMERALNTEKRLGLQSFENMADLWLSGDSASERPGKEKFLFKRNMTLNRLAAQTDRIVKEIKIVPLLNFPDYMARRHIDFQEKEKAAMAGPKVKDLYDKYGLFFFKNYTGEVLLNIAQPDFMVYAARINDIIVYSHLIRAQLELRLMDDRPEDIAEVLNGLGPETWNPYTGKPFTWDRENNTLWAEKGGARADSVERPKMEVGVPGLWP